MAIKYVLFDLDGTLLPMDHHKFSKKYFSLITAKLAPLGYDPTAIVNSIQSGIVSMVKNDGALFNEEICWRDLVKGLGEKVLEDKKTFDEFYRNDFDMIKDTCGYNEISAKVISLLHSKNIKTVLATNPLFPSVATEKRIAWAGLKMSDFEYVSVYENSHFSKPNIKYYEEIVEKLGLNAEECLMVGNDVEEDMIAARLGMKTFLVTDYLINRGNTDISAFPNGTLDDLMVYVEGLVR